MKTAGKSSGISTFLHRSAVSAVGVAVMLSARISAYAADTTGAVQVKSHSVSVPAVIAIILLAAAFAAIAVIIGILFKSEPEVDCAYAEKTLNACVIAVLPTFKDKPEENPVEPLSEADEPTEISDTEPSDDTVTETESGGEITTEVN